MTMDKDFYRGNRERLYGMMKPGSVLALFSGVEVRKTNDEFYPFYAHRSFVYLTGLEGRELALLAWKDAGGAVTVRGGQRPVGSTGRRTGRSRGMM